MRRVVVIALAVLALFALPQASEAETITAGSGQVRADLTYSVSANSYLAELGNLRVTRDATVAYDAKVDSCGGPCYVIGDTAGPETLKVMDLDLDGEPEVIASAYTGGAHCCAIAVILHYQPGTGTYAVTAQNFGDPGFSIEDLDNDLRPEFSTADSRFGYRFTAFAFSGMPVLIYRFDRGAFIDVSKDFRSAIRADSVSWRHWIRKGIKRGKLKRYNDLRGFYAAWAADEYRLGHATAVRRTLKKAARRGWLKGNGIGRQNAAFVRDLLGFLKRTGYR
ncbi:MAG: hypothetical protein JJE27_08760 [Thermoleophilia bacterium]|nr:hypothetical protein [Thermoleophilia bacterium]